MRVIESIEARGHPKVTALHRTTLEISREDHLTRRGDCIVAVGASRGAADLSRTFREVACRDGARISLTLRVGDASVVARGFGSNVMRLDHPRDLVVRKSGYVCGRTLMIHSDLAARDIARSVVRMLQSHLTRVEIELAAEH